MRLETISLSWFRGAADEASLDAGGKSIVIYGVNGAGKSSFVDAIEYAIKGKLNHLAHEYSGARQEKGLINTHKPQAAVTNIRLVFSGGLEHYIEIKADGTYTRAGSEAVDLPSWPYPAVVLRQDELAAFINNTKGEKYSTLLPLFGLADLEMAAENLRQLARTLKSDFEVSRKRGRIEDTEKRRREVFGAMTDTAIERTVAKLHEKYCSSSAATELVARCRELTTTLEELLREYEKRDRTHQALQAMAGVDIVGLVAKVRDVNAELATSVEPLVTEKLEILDSAQRLIAQLGDVGNTTCPACGLTVAVQQFKEHVKKEQERLQEIAALVRRRNLSIDDLIDGLKVIRENLRKADLREWREQVQLDAARAIDWIDTIDLDQYRRPREEDLNAIVDNTLVLLDAARRAATTAPPKVKELTDDKRTVDAAIAVAEGRALLAEILKIEGLVSYLESIEAEVRQQIRNRSQTVLDELSEDIKTMWLALRPGSQIKDIALTLPEGNKAIDIKLTFYGKEQSSPRLTLSEGHRNSLGLCIFLAMAKREASQDRPLILDDVVISLDREHRGMIGPLLEEQFGNRQVVILTHDRAWYTELTRQLPSEKWIFKRMLSYEGPETGIRWSDIATDFDDARSLLDARPDVAGNYARKIMDIELAHVAYKLRLRMPYLPGEKNDHRTWYDFLARLRASARKCLQKRENGVYVADDEAVALLDNASRLLEAWGNVGSHSFDLARPEATKLIDACEAALAVFKCGNCRKMVWYANAQNAELVQCECGYRRWRYGKDQTVEGNIKSGSNVTKLPVPAQAE